LPWGIIYIIKKLLKHRCPEWAHMTHLDVRNTSYGQKKGQESNWQFDSRAQKVMNRLDSLLCRWRATRLWKSLNEDYIFGLDFIRIGGLHKKLWTHKVVGNLNLVISRLPLMSPRTKSHLDANPVGRCRVYYMGEGGGFPWLWAVVSLVSLRLPVAHPSIKGAPTLC
jgi:hypothetical protein